MSLILLGRFKVVFPSMPWFTHVPHRVFQITAKLYAEELVAILLFFSMVLWLPFLRYVLGNAGLFWWLIVGSVGSFGCIVVFEMAILRNPRFMVKSASDGPSILEPPEYKKYGAPRQVGREVRVDGKQFRDSEGRRVHLRGINVGGMSKVPYGTTTNEPDIPYGAGVTFVGRPFPLAEAEVHLARLRAWGLTFLRLVVTWEALEPHRPDEYDEEYIEYIVKLVRKCREFGISVVIDPHQDAWSRWTGGDGAPRWTLEKIGLDADKLSAAGIAVLHEANLNDEAGDPERFYPHMVWPTNNFMFAAATMWAIFFAGEDYAPNTKIGDENAGEYLRRHYYGAVSALAEALKDEANVLGFETMNEPNMGWIGRDLGLDKYDSSQPLGYLASPWESMQLANGKSITVAKYGEAYKYLGHYTLNKEHVRAFLPGYRDPWYDNGVWDYDCEGKMRLLKKGYFDMKTKEDFQARYMRPFWKGVTEAVRRRMPDAIIFMGPALDMEKPRLHVASFEDAPSETRVVWAPHWYDGLTFQFCIYRTWAAMRVSEEGMHLVVGPDVAERVHKESLARVAHSGDQVGPTMLGESGVHWCGSYAATDMALNDGMRAIESSLIPAVTIWNYAPDNNEEDKDGWNKEDLSIFTSEPNPRLDSNGGPHLRMPSAVRPYPFKLAGKPLEVRFAGLSSDKTFILRFETDPKCTSHVSEIFVPLCIHYQEGVEVEVSDGSWKIDAPNQTLYYTHDSNVRTHTLRLCRSTTRVSVRSTEIGLGTTTNGKK